MSRPWLFVVNAVTYLFLIAAILLVHIPDVRGQHDEQGWRRLLIGINIAHGRPVLARLLLTMCIFSMVCLVYVGLFPSVARRNFDVDVDSASYNLLYTVWGVGACLGALAVGTVLAHIDRRRLIVDGFLLFAVSLAGFALVRTVGVAYPVAFVLGFAYFLAATALITIFQENLADTERAVVMPLWFMAFGGSIPLGNLIFGPGHRRHRGALGAGPGGGRRRVPGVVVRPAPDAARELPRPRGRWSRHRLRIAVRTPRARRRAVRGPRHDWP